MMVVAAIIGFVAGFGLAAVACAAGMADERRRMQQRVDRWHERQEAIAEGLREENDRLRIELAEADLRAG